MITDQVKEYEVKIDAEDIYALYKMVGMIEKLPIDAEWATNYLYAYDRIRDQIKKNAID